MKHLTLTNEDARELVDHLVNLEEILKPHSNISVTADQLSHLVSFRKRIQAQIANQV